MLKRIFSSFFALLAALWGFSPAPARRCAPQVSGSFVQAWYCADWDDARWDAETAWMKEAGLELLILQTVASRDADGVWTAYYPSALPELADGVAADVLGGALRGCKKAGLRLFVGLADFAGWWPGAGFSSAYLPACDLMARMVAEIAETYGGAYADVLAGWYFPPELDNIPAVKLSLPRIVKGLNLVLDAADAASPGLPVMLSPYYTEYQALRGTAVTLPMWQYVMNAAHWRDGDILCPQDAVGAGWTREKRLENAWRMYAAAVASAGVDVKLWANCENFTAARGKSFLGPPANGLTENAPAPADRFSRQLEVASRYAEKIVCFSMNHYYTPLGGDAAREGYRAYLKTLQQQEDKP